MIKMSKIEIKPQYHKQGNDSIIIESFKNFFLISCQIDGTGNVFKLTYNELAGLIKK